MSRSRLRNIAAPAYFRAASVEKWVDEFDVSGWCTFEVGDHFGVICAGKVEDPTGDFGGE